MSDPGTATTKGRPEAGHILISAAMLLIPLIAFASLAIDTGAWYVEHQRNQRAADAAALAGVVWMPDLPAAQSVALDAVRRNGYPGAVLTSSLAAFESAAPGDPPLVYVEATGQQSISVRLRTNGLVLFGTVFGVQQVSTRSLADALYVRPEVMGNPTSALGNGVDGPVPDHFWLNILPTTQVRNAGDLISSQQGRGGIPNPNHDPRGYLYVVDVPAGGTWNLQVRPTCYRQNRGRATYSLYFPDSTSYDAYDNVNAGNRAMTDTFGRERNPDNCEIPAPPAAPTSGAIAFAANIGACVDRDVASGWVQIWDCNGAANQTWTIDADGRLSTGGACAQVPAGSLGNGTFVTVGGCGGGDEARWSISGSTITNRASGRCLDLPSGTTTNGQNLQIWDCVGGSNQTWSTSVAPAGPPPAPTPNWSPAADGAQWHTLHNVGTRSGRWTFQAAHGGGSGRVLYSVRIVDAAGNTCTSAANPSCPTIAPLNWQGAFTQSDMFGPGSPASFTDSELWLADVGSEYAGNTLQVLLFDPADGIDAVKIEDPNGAFADFTWDTIDVDEFGYAGGGYYGADAGPYDQRCGGDSVVTSPTAAVACDPTQPERNWFQDRTVRIRIPIPDTPCVTDCWWKLVYVNGTNDSNETTTYRASIIGDPVRLTR
ncbi:MAG: RICIN domain-containing protein [Actinomycetota bacterium]